MLKREGEDHFGNDTTGLGSELPNCRMVFVFQSFSDVFGLEMLQSEPGHISCQMSTGLTYLCSFHISLCDLRFDSLPRLFGSIGTAANSTSG